MKVDFNDILKLNSIEIKEFFSHHDDWHLYDVFDIGPEQFLEIFNGYNFYYLKLVKDENTLIEKELFLSEKSKFYKSILSKNPHLLKFLLNNLSENTERALRVYEKWVTYRHLLSQHNNLLKLPSIENLEDAINLIIEESHYQKFFKKNFSVKYRNLLNKDNEVKLKLIYQLKLDKKTLSNELFKALGVCNTPDDLSLLLESILLQFTSWSYPEVKERAISFDAHIYQDSPFRLIIETENFNQLQALGTTQWCIAQHKDYFLDYTVELKSQYIIFDFTKREHNPESMIGVTINHKGKIVEAFDRYNQDILNKYNFDFVTFPTISSDEILAFSLKKEEPFHQLKSLLDLNEAELVYKRLDQLYENKSFDILEEFLSFMISIDEKVMIDYMICSYDDLLDINNRELFIQFCNNGHIKGITRYLDKMLTAHHHDYLFEVLALLMLNDQTEFLAIIIMRYIHDNKFLPKFSKEYSELISHLSLYSDFDYLLNLVFEFLGIDIASINFEHLISGHLTENTWQIIFSSITTPIYIDLNSIINNRLHITEEIQFSYNILLFKHKFNDKISFPSNWKEISKALYNSHVKNKIINDKYINLFKEYDEILK